jgi:hypothetical protein
LPDRSLVAAMLQIRLICAHVPTRLDAIGSTPNGLTCALRAGRSPS